MQRTLDSEQIPFAGLILAGGQGKRWGGPKAWAQLPDGTPFIDACTKTFDDAGASTIVATLPPEAERAGPNRLVSLRLPESGLDMFDSLRIGLGRLLQFKDWATVVMNPVDHPLVAASTVRALVESGHAAGIATVNGKHGHPICLSRQLASAVIEDPDAGPTLRHVLRAAGAADVAVDDLGAISNCNTPEMLAEHLARMVG